MSYAMRNAITLIATAENLEEACEMEEMFFWSDALTVDEKSEIVTIIGQLFA